MRSRPIRELSQVVENYLKVIYSHTEWQPEPITSSQLAQRLGVVPSSVTEMMKKLSDQGLVHHERYRAIRLTAAGRAEAIRMVRRHRLIETWLVREFGYGWDEVHDEAEVLEHALSDRLLDAIDASLGHPDRDPHGDPIPTADGRVPSLAGRRLSEVSADVRVRVARISDADPEVLRRLEEAGIGVGSELAAGEVASSDAHAIWVHEEISGDRNLP